jgi:hypothetical protein
MPRKSAAALTVLPPLPKMKRPEPPDELTEEQADEWRRVVSQVPPDWFPPDTHQLLVTYCRHVVRARMIDRWIAGFRSEFLMLADGLERVEKLFAMGEKEGRAISSLMTRMRLTQQSRYHTETAANKSRARTATTEPWQHVS